MSHSFVSAGGPAILPVSNTVQLPVAPLDAPEKRRQLERERETKEGREDKEIGDREIGREAIGTVAKEACVEIVKPTGIVLAESPDSGSPFFLRASRGSTGNAFRTDHSGPRSPLSLCRNPHDRVWVRSAVCQPRHSRFGLSLAHSCTVAYTHLTVRSMSE